ncbi:PKD domain-containing protein [Glutamicibacter soli]|uniref:PKD domain-containing protein n=1 Tax=Glutamicibacter soli TaxID=453836 RepID=A0A6L9G749_9MICC|nr:PKD domain-containing protein [Glutamicibacter soli]NAZ16803.1 PKD domain-containing protein [Glutamicibacter soli]
MKIKRIIAAVASVAVAAGIAGLSAVPAQASEQEYNSVVSSSPASNTPHVLDGIVFSVAEVGDLIVLGGSFTQVQAANGGPVLSRNRIVAFNKNTGAISTGFVPNFNSTVRSVVASPDGNSVYVGGQFGTLNGASVPKVVRLNTANGARITQFNTGNIDAVVHDLKLVGNRMFIGGEFATVRGQTRTGLAEVNATTGALSDATNVVFAGTHNGGSTFVHKFDVSPDGKTLVATGNFSTINGQDRVQVGVLDLSGANTVVADWHTDRWKPMCYSVFAYYLNDLDWSPDGSYFVLSSMGGYGSGPPTLCDTVSRWEADDAGNQINPAWVDYTGGDSVYAVEATGETVYYGGHMRWINNPFRADAAGQGAVDREGIGALNASNGMPIDWNPGRDRGRGVFDLLATSQGLWVGSDTDRIARYIYRGRIALFPLANGSQIPQADEVELPVDVLQAGASNGPTDPRYLYRLNTGGPTLSATDSGIDWITDNTAPGSNYRTSGSNVASYEAVGSLDGSVPQTTPIGLFSDERWDAAGGNRLEYAFPVDNGKNVQVRIYLADRCNCTTAPGSRVYDVNVENQLAFDNVDINANPGHNIGTMISKNVVSDGNINISFDHVTENPAVYGIEIVDLDAQAPVEDSTVPEVYFDGSQSASKGATELSSDVDWEQVRGGFIGDGKVYLAMSNGTLQARNYNGASLGGATSLELYGLTNFSSEIQQMTGLFLANNRIYFTLAGDANLYMRYFDLSSQIVGAQRFTIASAASSGIDFRQVRGMFLIGDTLYYATPNGALNAVDWAQTATDGAPNGATRVVSNPDDNGVFWAANALLAMDSDGAPPLPNQPPTAVAGGDCTGLTCSFTGSGSNDPDGDIASYAWQFGDGESGTGEVAEHNYAAAGTYTATLTVSDADGATATDEVTVEVTEPPNAAPEAAITTTCDQLACSFDSVTSSDSDGEIVSWAWTSSDGGSSSDAIFEHEFAAAGTYQVTLTVTDDDGETDSVEVDVEVSTTPNELPTAAFSVDCVYLSCTFDGTTSSDPDGTLTGYSWEVDGSAVATGMAATYVFGAEGTYQVTLTVTDDSGATNAITQPVSVVEDTGPTPGNEVAFVNSAANPGTATTQSHSVGVPGDVEEGDLMIAVLSLNSGSNNISTPNGWELRAGAATTSMSGAVFSKVATAGDAGSTLSVNAGTLARGSLVLSAYRDATVQAASFAMQAQVGSAAGHTTPELASAPTSWLLSYWADKTGSTTSWSVPSGATARQTGAGTGGGHLSWLLADSNGQVGSSTAGGLTATADSATANAVMASVVLAATQPSGNNADPTASFSVDCEFLSCYFDASDSSDPEGALLEYVWSVDGVEIAQGLTATYQFPTAGTHSVELTVSDPQGGSDSVSQEVEVSEDTGTTPDAEVTFVDSAESGGTSSAMTHSVAIPASVQAGDLLVAVFSTNQYSEAISAPSGWEQHAQAATASMQSAMFSRVATAADAGATLNVTSGIYARGTLVVSVYRDAQVSAASFTMEGETSSKATHVTPEATAVAGDWVLSYWADKSALTTAWSIPSTQAERQTGAGAGAGHLSWMLADSGDEVSAGTVGGLTGTANSSTANAVMGTVVISAQE